MHMEREQIQADLLRTLYRLELIEYDRLDKICDELTIRMFRRLYSPKS